MSINFSGGTNIISPGISTFVGGINVSGVITATTFVGNFSGSITNATRAGISTSVIGGIASVTSLSVSGITTLGVVTAVTSINFSSGALLGDPYEDGGFGLKSGANQYAIIASNNLQQYIQVDDNYIFIGTGYASTTGSYDWVFNKNGNLTFPDNTSQTTAFTGIATYATNLSGGSADASQLNVSGVATVSQGRIQVDAGSNLRFGNIAAGSGSGRNIAIGDQVLTSLSGGSGRNIGVGELSYYDTTSGQYNIGLGIQAGQKITTGSYNVIIGGYNGQTGLDLRTSSNNIVIADGQGNIRQYIDSSGNVGIKTTVITEALTVSGIISATSFYGILNASQLTGKLPAIDGSSLFGVTATGSGVQVRDDGSIVGTAATIDFGANISVSFASGIATVSGASSVSAATTAYALAGIPNLNVGIVTATSFNGPLTGNVTGNLTGNVTGNLTGNITGTSGYAETAGISSAVSGTININTSGIITASSFSGSGSGLTNLPSGQLTGALPAIDGSLLLNLPPQPGSGINVSDNNVSVGSARTVDFGTGLDVTIGGGIATVTASGGSLQSRTVVTGVTTSIANNGIGNTNITGFKSYSLMKVGLSTIGWLRLYTDSASRSADASRNVGIDPTPGSGVIAEVVTTGISTTQIISPFVMGGNLDEPASTTIYAAITNLSGTTQQITANLTILQLEA